MMSLRKMLWVATALGVLAGAAWADPMRTVFTKENKFPGALKPELSLAGGGSSFEVDGADADIERYFVTPGVRFGLTDRLTLLAAACASRASAFCSATLSCGLLQALTSSAAAPAAMNPESRPISLTRPMPLGAPLDSQWAPSRMARADSMAEK